MYGMSSLAAIISRKGVKGPHTARGIEFGITSKGNVFYIKMYSAGKIIECAAHILHRGKQASV